MRSALSHARDWLCLGGAVGLVLYITLVPQRPAHPPLYGDRVSHGGASAGVDRPRLVAGNDRLSTEVGQ